MKTKHIYCAIAVMVLCTVSASAQWSTSNSSFNSTAEAPSTIFHSTSAMQGSNSVYASTPAVNEYGMADATGAVAHPGNPRRVGPPTPGGDPTPLGDAALPLLLMAGAYAFIRVRRVRRDFC